MITRRHLRTKVMQALYAQQLDPTDNLKTGESWILKSSQDFYLLYITLLDLFRELHACGYALYDKNTKKHLQEDENETNPKFFSNKALLALCNNAVLAAQVKKHKLKYWKNHDEYVRLVWDEITASTIYDEYLKTETTSLAQDQDFLVQLFSKVIAPFNRLDEFMEEVNISWVDDAPLANTTVRNSLKRVAEIDAIITVLYKDDEDRKFSLELFRKVVLNKSELIEEIKGRTPNWDPDRIAELDFTLLLMALAELFYFPSIPVNVTINEYLEISKEYATPKSSMFINGVLDNVVKDMTKKKRIRKNVRGMQ
ncbi:MAG: transcription antitermination factor NusB [Flavobacteriaceae bacterium]|nr:transcription antitermination factor NusB [Flavobacteriaceae bacterium]|tara:strand:- start:800 stop:1732 length:933 start_codon:yes stop_codon:yes gene_type:complete